MFRKANIQHYKSVLIFGTYVYFLWKIFSIFLSPIPEPLWARFPVLIFGSYSLYKLRKETSSVKFESYTYWLSLITILDYCYLIYTNFSVSEYVFKLYASGGLLIFGGYTMAWKDSRILRNYSLITLVVVSVLFISIGINKSLNIGFWNYYLLFISMIGTVAVMNYKNLKRTEEIISKLLISEAKSIKASEMKQIADMAGGIAHEIRNPLASMSMALEMIELKIAGSGIDVSKYLVTISKSKTRIVNTIDTLLAFSDCKTETSPDTKAYNLKSIVNNMIKICKSKYNHLEVDIRFNSSLNVDILCDQTSMSQAIFNILVNSFEALEKTPKDFDCRILIYLNLNPDDSMITLDILDNAPKIDKLLNSKLFIPFFTTKGLSENAGTGLSVSKGILIELGGDIVYQSDPKKFSLKIPASIISDRRAI